MTPIDLINSTCVAELRKKNAKSVEKSDLSPLSIKLEKG